MSDDSAVKGLISELRKHKRERDIYIHTGNNAEDQRFYEDKDYKIIELIKKLEGTSHLFIGSAEFRRFKTDFIV